MYNIFLVALTSEKCQTSKLPKIHNLYTLDIIKHKNSHSIYPRTGDGESLWIIEPDKDS